MVIFFSIFNSTGNLNSESLSYSENSDFEWQITFEDDFDIFDNGKWLTTYESGGRTNWANKELQWYKDENVKAENGILKITAKKESVYGNDLHGEKQFEYTSGIICSSDKFTQAYGKWEIKVKFPFRKGFWPAFWLVANQKPGLPEIDIFEYFGKKENSIASVHHWGLDYPHYSGNVYEGKGEPFYYVSGKETEGKFADEWMIWTFECYPDRLVWKLNGNTVFEATDGIPTSKMYMIANVAVKDWEENNFEVDNSEIPYVMEVDYIRVYKMTPIGN
ncbi:MAG: glycoside hydrolase family 16 protein [Ignavibacteria bacterium]|nr:glycoside hydrolase family 16 protein [Ignavibacteria bacterium]